jgi:hypothetical protein
VAPRIAWASSCACARRAVREWDGECRGSAVGAWRLGAAPAGRGDAHLRQQVANAQRLAITHSQHLPAAGDAGRGELAPQPRHIDAWATSS